jgi:hypothetical protein
MRKSFDALSALVQECFGQDLLAGHLFLFLNRRRDRIKILAWEEGGMVVRYKRLEAGTFQKLDPRRSVPMLERLGAYMREQKDSALPKSRYGQAIGYALNHWDGVRRFTEDGRLEIDNNTAERTVRLCAQPHELALRRERSRWQDGGDLLQRPGRRQAAQDRAVGVCARLADNSVVGRDGPGEAAARRLDRRSP